MDDKRWFLCFSAQPVEALKYGGLSRNLTLKPKFSGVVDQ